MFFSEFETLMSGGATLDAHAASQPQAAYCVVGNGLVLRGVVLFKFRVDEAGVCDPSFNVPLRYLVKVAGSGPDLGSGPVKSASRGQCPVPWHAGNLWEPNDLEVCLQGIQKRIYRNKLKLRTSLGVADNADQLGATALEDVVLTPSHTAAQTAALEEKLTQTFGQDGRLSLQKVLRAHAEQLQDAKAQYRTDLEAQQQAYLDQLRTARDEIHDLKVALRQEQGRNQRLQQMLRGEV